jgi:hypothetical protein
MAKDPLLVKKLAMTLAMTLEASAMLPIGPLDPKDQKNPQASEDHRVGMGNFQVDRDSS